MTLPNSKKKFPAISEFRLGIGGLWVRTPALLLATFDPARPKIRPCMHV